MLTTRNSSIFIKTTLWGNCPNEMDNDNSWCTCPAGNWGSKCPHCFWIKYWHPDYGISTMSGKLWLFQRSPFDISDIHLFGWATVWHSRYMWPCDGRDRVKNHVYGPYRLHNPARCHSTTELKGQQKMILSISEDTQNIIKCTCTIQQWPIVHHLQGFVNFPTYPQILKKVHPKQFFF
jgi:hypothetical protein